MSYNIDSYNSQCFNDICLPNTNTSIKRIIINNDPIFVCLFL